MNHYRMDFRKPTRLPLPMGKVLVAARLIFLPPFSCQMVFAVANEVGKRSRCNLLASLNLRGHSVQ